MSAFVFGYAFLYLPILSLMVYSFNESSLVTVWAGFSTRWYAELFHNESLLHAGWISLKIAAMTATFAVIGGTAAAVIIVRFRRLRHPSLFQGLITSPLGVPDVITGLALFVNMEQIFGWPRRGIMTTTFAHTALAMAYVVVIIRARLLDFDRSLEEAALDLGARPLTVFFRITLPLISPSLMAGWLLAFTLSLDDVVIASFVSGPGSTTLPMVVFSSVRRGLSPQINALGTIIVCIVAIGVMMAGIILHRRMQRSKVLL
jgi:putrescine transport system permease protein